MKILLLGANFRAMLSVAQSLHEGYPKSTIDLADSIEFPFQQSKYINHYHLLPDPQNCVNSFGAKLLELLKIGNYDRLLPINDLGVLVTTLFYSEIEKLVETIATSSLEHLQYASNKYKLLKLVDSLDLPIPETVFLKKGSEYLVNSLSISYPIIVKPVSTWQVLGNKATIFTVKKAFSPEELKNILDELLPKTDLMMQPFLVGFDVGFNFFTTKGQLQNFYADRQVHGHIGSEASYRERISDNIYSLKEYSERILNVIGWNGVGMFDYRISNKKAFPLELNGRYWASVALGYKIGINFPVLAVQQNFRLSSAQSCQKNIYDESSPERIRNIFLEIKSQLNDHSLRGLIILIFQLTRNFFNKNELWEDSLTRDSKLRRQVLWYRIGNMIRTQNQKKTKN